ncbi:hypothetical protein DH2020_024967 [Rehmannia glutinosa]|uniref:Casein kinase substrate phosphoprotein PP28 domain-containing protein n=1 Tax=Rehmannia glutinosa TaxID=99300 RepID=A0ABR0W112_REHGL
MGRGKFKGKPTGAAISPPPKRCWLVPLLDLALSRKEEGEVEEEMSMWTVRRKLRMNQKSERGLGVIQVENPNLAKPKNLKACDVDIEKTTELLRREREEIEKLGAHERYMRSKEQGKTDQAKKELERLALIRQQRVKSLRNGKRRKLPKNRRRGGSSQMILHAWNNGVKTSNDF